MSKLYYLITFLFVSGALAAADELPKLTVQGHAILHKPADQMSLTLGITTLAKEAETALSENSQKMQYMIEELKKNGLEKSEFQTGQFSIQPTYTPYPKNPPPDWKPSINGYEVTNTIVIKTDKIQQIGTFIDVASRAGANKVDNIHASLKEERPYWEEAIVLATRNAMGTAQVIAETAGVQTIRIFSITLNDTDLQPPQPLSPMLFKARAAEVNTPIEPGDVEIRAHITLVYEIGKK